MEDNIASLEARILSLEADALLVLGRLSLGESDSQIISWSNGWNFTQFKIRSALSRIYATFGLDGPEDAKRGKAAAYYKAWLDQFLATRQNMSRSAKQEDAIDETTKHRGDEMGALQESRPDIRIVPFERKPRVDLRRIAKGIPNLTPRQRALVECLCNDADDETAGKRLGMSKYSIPSMLSAICKRVGIGSLIPSKTARIYLAAAMHQAKGDVEKASQLQTAAEASFDSSHPKEPSIPAAPRPALTIPEAMHIEMPANPAIAHVTSRISVLAPRLRAVAAYVAQGLKNDEIAKRLNLSPQSCSNYTVELWKLLGLSESVEPKDRRAILAEAFNASKTTSDHTPTRVEVVEPVKPDIVRCDIEAKTPIDPPAPPVERNELPSVAMSHPLPTVSPDSNETKGAIAEKNAVERYGSGVPVVLTDPASIEDIEVLSGEHQSAEFAARIADGKQRGLRPEILVLVPTTDPHRTHAQIVLIRRS